MRKISPCCGEENVYVFLVFPFLTPFSPDMMSLISTALGVQHAFSTDSALSHVNLLTQG